MRAIAMCKELSEELERGDRAIKELASHLLAMGASTLERVVVVDGAIVKVSALVASRPVAGEEGDRNS